MNNKAIIQAMKQRVYEANLALPKLGLVKLTWGNVSEINRSLGIIVIKPSGVKYQEMTKEQMVVTDLKGQLLETNSVTWTQAGRALPPCGTTHADAFYGAVPCTRALSESEIKENYEEETGKVIVETFHEQELDPLAVPGVLVYGHGPFTWGMTPEKAVENSLILDEICSMARLTEIINPDVEPIDHFLLDKHYFRKHGISAYYGQ